MNSSFKAVNALLARGFEVCRTMVPAGPPGRETTGAFYIPAREGLAEVLEECAAAWGVRVGPADPSKMAGLPALRLRKPRVGLYQSYAATADEGWTRFIFDDYGFSYGTLNDAAVRGGGGGGDSGGKGGGRGSGSGGGDGGLRGLYDVIILPSQRPAEISDGLAAGAADARYTGGLGEAGRAAIRDFAHGGGTLICLGAASDWATDALGLRVRNVLRGLKAEEFYLPGSMLRAYLDTSHPVAYGMPAETTVLHVGSPAFEVLEGRVIGRYAPSQVLRSGWILGEKHIQDRACIVEVPYGRGRVILVGPRVQHRAQTRGTYRLLFNAIYSGAADEVKL